MSQKSIEDILRMGRDLGDLINVDDSFWNTYLNN